ncbi:MAG: alpha/beta hydrolase [Alistipes indistinctus]
MKTYYSNELQVTPQTPPTLLLLSNNDGTVKPRNSIMFYEALRENRVLTALYIFPSGGHGWGFRDTFAYHEIMKTLILQWIAELWPEQASAPK